MAASAVKLTISLPAALARETAELARNEGRSISSIIQEALRIARAERLKRELHDIQGFWSAKAREKGVLTERQLTRYLRD